MSAKGSITTADYFKYDEFKRLVDCLSKDGKHIWAFYCILSFCLGLRASDVRKLKWGDVLDKRSVIVTEQKTGKTKGIPIGQNTADRISEMYKVAGKPKLSSYIFSSQRSHGEPITIQYINKIAKGGRESTILKLATSAHTLSERLSDGTCMKKEIEVLMRSLSSTESSDTQVCRSHLYISE